MEIGETRSGRRIYCNPDGSYKLDPGDYVKISNGTFMARIPESKFHTGSLEGHEVIEHEDETITVSPSILHTEPNVGQWHGYLEHGVWRRV